MTRISEISLPTPLQEYCENVTFFNFCSLLTRVFFCTWVCVILILKQGVKSIRIWLSKIYINIEPLVVQNLFEVFYQVTSDYIQQIILHKHYSHSYDMKNVYDKRQEENLECFNNFLSLRLNTILAQTSFLPYCPCKYSEIFKIQI